MKIYFLIATLLSSAFASDANFNKGKQVAETLKGKVP